jgi:F-type H+-transporting ATPase subunit gamma
LAKAREILKRRKAVVNTMKITKTMEMIATAKFSKAISRRSGSRSYRETLEKMAAILFQDSSHPLTTAREHCGHTTLLVLTSNRGLCGGYNSGLLRLAKKHYGDLIEKGAEVSLWMSGKKGHGYAKYNQLPLARKLVSPEDKTTWEDTVRLARELADDFLDGKTDRVEVVYNSFTSTTAHRPGVEQLIPLSLPTPEEGRDYFWEPGPEKMREEILCRALEHRLFSIYLESGAVEQVARRIAMKNATDSAEEMIKTLTRFYNRARQYQITQEISELMGGSEALQKS